MTPEEYNKAAEQLQRDLAEAGTLMDFKVASYLQNRFRFPLLVADSEAEALGWSDEEFYVRWSVEIGSRQLCGFVQVPSHLITDDQSYILQAVAYYVGSAVISPGIVIIEDWDAIQFMPYDATRMEGLLKNYKRQAERAQ